jgi:predicted kinase
VAALIFLNGPSASGKSTLAARLVERRPLALNIDIVRGQLGRWLDDPNAAGLAARALALAMIDTHLRAGHDVVIPQFLARPDFIEELSRTAHAADAHFVELALEIPRSDAIAAFVERSADPADQTHVDAAALVNRSNRPDRRHVRRARSSARAAPQPHARPRHPRRRRRDAQNRGRSDCGIWDELVIL